MDEEKRPQDEGPLPRSREAVDWWLREWGRHAVVDGKEPLTREDVERLIEANGGTAEGLYLVGANLQGAGLVGANLQGAGLGGANLQGAVLIGANLQGAVLRQANLQGAYLRGADLQGANLTGARFQGARLWNADFQGARLSRTELQDAILWIANLQGAKLRGANLRGADLAGARISPDTDLEGVKWDKDYISILERRGEFGQAIALYRRLKRWYEEAGMLSIAGEFHYREREAARKLQWHRLRNELKELKQSLTTAWRRLRGRGSRALKE